MQQILVGIEEARQRFDLKNILNFLQVSLTTLGMISIAWLRARTLALMKWQVVTNLAMLFVRALVAWSLVRELKPQFRGSNQRRWEIVRYSTATCFTALDSTLFQQGDRAIVSGQLETNLLGVYAIIATVTKHTIRNGAANIFRSYALTG